MAKAVRQVNKIDASGQTVGRLSSRIALILRGKDKPEFLPNIDSGGVVEVINIKDLKFSGKKFEQKNYYHYSGYQSGLKTIKMKNVFLTKPAEVLKRAVFQMLPPTRLRKNMIKRLVIK